MRKREPAIVNVIRGYGIEVRKSGQLYLCNCPFHEGGTSKETITINQDAFSWFFKCWACGAAGRDDQTWEKLYHAGKEAKDGKASPG
jgi:DNA primase